MNPTTNTALIVIDIQKDFCDPDRANSSITGISQLIPKLLKAIKQLKSLGVKVIYTRYIENSKTPNNITSLGLSGKCQEGSEGAELFIIDEVDPDLTIDKPTWDAFSNSELINYLKSNNIKNLFITGISTQTCVFSTVSGAFKEGFSPIVISDLVSSKDKHSKFKDPILDIIDTYYGKVLTLTEATKLITQKN